LTPYLAEKCTVDVMEVSVELVSIKRDSGGGGSKSVPDFLSLDPDEVVIEEVGKLSGNHYNKKGLLQEGDSRPKRKRTVHTDGSGDVEIGYGMVTEGNSSGYWQASFIRCCLPKVPRRREKLTNGNKVTDGTYHFLARVKLSLNGRVLQVWSHSTYEFLSSVVSERNNRNGKLLRTLYAFQLSRLSSPHVIITHVLNIFVPIYIQWIKTVFSCVWIQVTQKCAAWGTLLLKLRAPLANSESTVLSLFDTFYRKGTGKGFTTVQRSHIAGKLTKLRYDSMSFSSPSTQLKK
jgi:hypothetical protein